MKNAKNIVCILVAVTILLFIFILIKGGILSGDVNSGLEAELSGLEKGEGESEDGESVDDREAKSEENGGEKEDDGETSQDARYKQIEINSNLKPKDTYYEFKNDKLAWWFKRDQNHGKSGCDDTVELSSYGAYYLDDTVDANSQDKVIYLTFDCGYENGYTNKILDVLKKEDVPACFFVTKTFVRDNVDIVKRMKEEGHQVGNHTITHPSLPTKSFEEIVEEIEGTASYMEEVTGYKMDPYLRPPKGEYSCRTLAITHDLGYKTIFWSMAYVDYDVNKQPGADYVIEHFNKYHHNGAIVLMHNVSSSNAEALETVINNLKKEGYRFVSLNELR